MPEGSSIGQGRGGNPGVGRSGHRAVGRMEKREEKRTDRTRYLHCIYSGGYAVGRSKDGEREKEGGDLME